jgi:acetyl esterase/lipase
MSLLMPAGHGRNEMNTSSSRRRLSLIIVAVLVLLLSAVAAPPAEAQSDTVKGPDPTASALERDGPFTIKSTSVSDLATPGFGAADIYYPADDSQGPYGGVIIFPGFTATRSSMAWLARRVASHGFVVLNANTNTILDFPGSRGQQILDAVDYLRSSSEVQDLVDGDRIGVMGHSMGGGGTLAAISKDPSIDAAVPLTPWNFDKTWGEVTTPTLIIGAENDLIASVGFHAIPFYESMSSTTERAYLELNGASHFAPALWDSTISRYSIAWLKRHVDDDTRYTQFICPGPGTDREISDYRSDCDSSGGDDSGSVPGS